MHLKNIESHHTLKKTENGKLVSSNQLQAAAHTCGHKNTKLTLMHKHSI